MKIIFLSIAVLGFSLPSGFACDFQRSAQNTEATDKTVVASIAVPQSEPAAPLADADTPAELIAE